MKHGNVKHFFTLILAVSNYALLVACGTNITSDSQDTLKSTSELNSSVQTTIPTTSALTENQNTSQTSIIETTEVSDLESIETNMMTKNVTTVNTVASTTMLTTFLSTTAKPAAASSFSWDSGGNYSGAININNASATGQTVYDQNGATIDIGNSSNGYIMVKKTGSNKRLKVQIKKDSMTYNYDLNNVGAYEVYPLQMGSGIYTVRIMENVTGTSYIEAYNTDITVTLKNEFVPFLYPNQYVNYTSSSSAVKKSYDLCLNSKSDLDKLKSIYNYITTTITYDKEKAANVTAGYLPDVDTTLSTSKGICFDYSSLMACMLRAQNIPAKLVIGTAGTASYNHAWNEVYIKDTGWITVQLMVNASTWTLLDSTFGASSSTGSNYTKARIY